MPIAFAASPFCPAFRRATLSSRRGGALLDCWPREGAATVLFVPGTMLGPLQYRVFLRALYEQGFSVAALHLTGHGAAHHIWRFRLPDILDDVRHAVAYLQQHHRGPILLCGHSQGGIMTLALACGGSLSRGSAQAVSIAPLDGVSAFFAVSAAFPQYDDVLRLTLLGSLQEHRRTIQEILLRLTRCFPWLPLPLFCYLSPRRLLAGHGSIDLPLVGRRLTYPLALLTDLLALHINESTAKPFFLLGARNDALFSPEVLRLTLERLDAPFKKLHLLPSGGHMLLMQAETAREAAAYLALHACALALPLQCGYTVPKD